MHEKNPLISNMKLKRKVEKDWLCEHRKQHLSFKCPDELIHTLQSELYSLELKIYDHQRDGHYLMINYYCRMSSSFQHSHEFPNCYFFSFFPIKLKCIPIIVLELVFELINKKIKICPA